MTRIACTVNGKSVEAEVAPRTHLADFLRESLLLTGTHIGCEHGICGACTVEINGEIARSCITYAVTCDGAEVRTIESFDDDALMQELRTAFTEHHALQCGYCTPGMLIAARDLIRRKGRLARPQIRSEMGGNLCRCTGYLGIINAIEAVMAKHPAPTPPPAASNWLGPPPGPTLGKPATVAATPPARRTAVGALARPASAAPIEVKLASFEDRDGRVGLEQAFVLPHPLVAVWGLVSNVERLARCVPGLSLDGAPDGERVAGSLDVRLGPITARFTGHGRVRTNASARRLEVEGQGRDRKGGSSVTGRLGLALEASGEAGEATVVRLDLSYALTGPLAQFGRGGIARDLARRLGEMFAQNSNALLHDPSAAPAAGPLSGLALLLEIARARLAAWLGRWRGDRAA